jgi:hypothetical protein
MFSLAMAKGNPYNAAIVKKSVPFFLIRKARF